MFAYLFFLKKVFLFVIANLVDCNLILIDYATLRWKLSQITSFPPQRCQRFVIHPQN